VQQRTPGEKAPTGQRYAGFRVEPKFQNGIPILAPSNEFEVLIFGPDDTLLAHQIRESNDGTFSVIFPPHASGVHTISVKYKGEHIKDSVFRMNVGTEHLHPNSKSWKPKTPKPEFTPVSGKTFAKFSLADKLIDQGGRPIRVFQDLDITVTDPNDAQIGFKFENQAVVFQPLISGDYNIAVTWKGINIKGSPFVVPVDSKPEELYTSSEAKLDIAPKDKKGRTITSPVSEFKVKAYGPDDKRIECRLTEGTVSGQYSVVFKPVGHGVYRLHIRHKGKKVIGSPFKIEMGEGSAALPQLKTTV